MFARMIHPQLLVVLQCAILGIWLNVPTLEWAVLACGIALCAVVVSVWLRQYAPLLVAGIGIVTSGAAIVFSWQVRQVEVAWPELREEIFTDAGSVLSEMLDSGVDLVLAMADSAANVVAKSPADAYAELEPAVGQGGPERGAAVFDSSGSAIAWAGRHRVAPAFGAEGVSARITQFYVLLEAQRQAGTRIGMSQVVLWADSAVPDRSETLAERFYRRTGAGLAFYPTWAAHTDNAGIFDYTIANDTLFSVEVIPPAQGDLKLELNETGRRIVALGSIATLVLFAVTAPIFLRWMGALGVAMLLVFTPAGNRLGLGGLFSEATYYLDVLGPFTASAGALLALASLCVLALLRISRWNLRRMWVGLLVAAALVLSAPFAMATLATGITPPSSGLGVGLWLSWETTLTVASAAILLATGMLVRGGREFTAPAWTVGVAVVLVVGVSVIGLIIWSPVGGWPLWYAFLWFPAILLAVLPAPRLRRLAVVAVVAGAGAALLTWGGVVQGRLLMAERDVGRVKGGDAIPMGYLERFGETLLERGVPRTTAELYALWHHSFLSQQEYPAVLASWSSNAELLARLDLADLDLSSELLQFIATEPGAAIEVTRVNRPDGVIYLTAVPFPDGSVLTVGVGPRSRLVEPARLARFLRGERRVIAPFEMSAGESTAELAPESGVSWRRDGWTIRGVSSLEPQPGVRSALRIHVPLGGLGQKLVRGALVLVWNVVLIGLLWLIGEGLTGRLVLPPGIHSWLAVRSYRARLTFVLAGFFMLPTLGYAAWTVQRTRGNAERSRDLLIGQTLSDAAGEARQFVDIDRGALRIRLTDLARRLNTDLIWYDGGVLRQASPAVLAELGLLDHFMPPEVFHSTELSDELEVTVNVSVGGHATRMGYRNFRGLGESGATLAVPRLVDVRDILTEQEDLLYGLSLSTLIGLAAAVLLSAIAARQLAYPVRSLRDAAVAVGSGEPIPPFGSTVPTEFVSVVEAFERMARDIDRSQSALEAARRRTATVLKNVATGVVALDREMRVMIANPRVEQLLAAPLPPGAHIHVVGGAEWVPVWKWVRGFLNGRLESDSSEFTVGDAQIRAQISAMHGEPSGCVLALDDTTELTRAVRVLAWGELARQIAHEIKNPLTPIRLGIQHLKRTYGDPGRDFGHTLDRTAQQILAEIERLDSIARAFARFGAPLAESEPLVSGDLAAIAHETAELYALGGGTTVTVNANEPVVAEFRKDEVKEVLVNLIENARDGDATEVEVNVEGGGARRAIIAVKDNGKGIPKSDLPHVFEPQFSTTTSGTGLGLAICKRLVESWGGEIDLESEVDTGTTVRVTLPEPQS